MELGLSIMKILDHKKRLDHVFRLIQMHVMDHVLNPILTIGSQNKHGSQIKVGSHIKPNGKACNGSPVETTSYAIGSHFFSF